MRRMLLFLLLALSLRADVTLAPLFTDHAILQRDKPLPVWGRADPKERVTVAFRGQTLAATAGPDGRWIVYLDPVPGSTTPAELVVTGKNTLRLANILVGDLWLCSGQSNMEWTVAQSANAPDEIAAANNPFIRHFKVARAVADAPADTAAGTWTLCTPATAGEFTAIGYFFARDLQSRLGVPIGIINSTWEGTPIESWMSAAALAGDPASAAIAARWQQSLSELPAKKAAYDTALAAWLADEAAAKAASQPFTRPRPKLPRGPGHPWTPSGLFNGMIHPLIPCALRGILWYQGEGNFRYAPEYRTLFPSLITHWRTLFGQPDLPFLWVQLSNYSESPKDPTRTTWAWIRDAQTKALALPATCQAITLDIGDPDDIHPKNKQEVGRRLALIARAKAYGATLDHTGPVFAGATPEGSALRVRFTPVGTGLTASDKPLTGFEIAGSDQIFFPAAAKIENDTVLVSAPEVPAPVAVRYAWTNAPDANLRDGNGLPAGPFRSDDWPPPPPLGHPAPPPPPVPTPEPPTAPPSTPQP